MFRITEINNHGIISFRLEDESSGTFAEVVPESGAILNNFSIQLADGPLNVIQGYSDLSKFAAEVETGGFRSCKLSPFVNRLKNGRYHFGEKEYQIEKYFLGKHSMHGLLYDAKFEVVSQSTDAKGATLVCRYSYRGGVTGYPFHYDIEIEYSLRISNRLRIITTLQNQDRGLIPVADGWHPYFGFGGKIDDVWLEFQTKEMLELDEDMLPTGKLTRYEEYGSLKQIGDARLDHCFTVNFHECQPMIVLRDSHRKLQLEIQPHESYAYLQVYTPEDRKSIALENMSAAPDAFNNAMGLHVLEPGESIQFRLFFSLRDLSKP